MSKVANELVIEFPNEMQGFLEAGAAFNSKILAAASTQGVSWTSTETHIITGATPGFKTGRKVKGSVVDTPEKITVSPLVLTSGFRMARESMELAKERGNFESLLATKMKEDLKEVFKSIDFAIISGKDRKDNEVLAAYDNKYGNFAKGVTNVIAPTAKPTQDIYDSIEKLVDFEATNIMSSIAGYTDVYKEVDTSKLVQLGKDLAVMGVVVEKSSSIQSPVKYITGDFSKLRYGIRTLDDGLKMVEYGDPDNTGFDLQGTREVYFGYDIQVSWVITHPQAFAMVATEEVAEG